MIKGLDPGASAFELSKFWSMAAGAGKMRLDLMILLIILWELITSLPQLHPVMDPSN